MSRRIDVEITSDGGNGSWTWRAAGARQPKGTIEAALLPAGSKVGDVLRAEVEQFVDGMTVLAVLPSKGARKEPELLEILGSGKQEELVTTRLAPGGGGGGGGRDGRGRGRGDRGDRGNRGGGRGREGGNRDGGDRGRGGERRPSTPQRPKPKRLRPGTTHRTALIEGLPVEEQPIADQLRQGGLPGVRQAIEKQNEQAKADGQPEIKPEPLMSIAEKLVPRMRTAEWLDRAEAAKNDIEELDLRDLRSVVVAADQGARDDESLALAAELREALERRIAADHALWLSDMDEMLTGGRIVAALRRSSRPPKAGTPLPKEMATKMIEQATAALATDVMHDRYAIVLDALAYSPVRLSVKPEAAPAEPSDELKAAVTNLAQRLPDIATLFGIDPATAKPPRRRGGKGGPGGGRNRSGAKGAGDRGPKGKPDAPAAAATGDASAPTAEASTPDAPAPETPAADTPVPDAAEAATPEASTVTDASPAEETPAEPAPVTDAPADAAPVAEAPADAAPAEAEPVAAPDVDLTPTGDAASDVEGSEVS